MNLPNDYQDRLLAGFDLVVIELAQDSGVSRLEIWEDGLTICEIGCGKPVHDHAPDERGR